MSDIKNTLITFVLDRSGSMSMGLDATIEAFNAYLAGLKEGEGVDQTQFTLVYFDSQSIDKVHFEKPIREVPDLSRQNYQPRGGTPLIDAAYETITALQAAVDRKEEKPNVIVCIQTDGEENSSSKHTWDALKELITAKQAQGWQFNFMGAGIDAYKQASMMGLGADATVSYDRNDVGATRAAFAATAENAVMYRSGAAMSTGYSTMQKMASGDVFDKGLAQARKKEEEKGGITL